MRTVKKIIFSIVTTAFLLFISEICIRIFWKDAPDNYLSIYKYYVKFLPDNKRLRYDHVTNWRGEASGVIVSTNEAGLRDISENEYMKKKLILFSGDSIFFGFGVNQNFTITNQLNNKLAQFKDFHNLNNGVCGYNLIQSFDKTKMLIERYPSVKYVFFSFIHNDVEDLFSTVNSDTGLYPEIKSAYFNEPDKRTFLFRLLNLIMPEDMLSIRYGKKISFRKILLRYSKLYLFIALNLKKITYAGAAGESGKRYLLPELKISEILIYQPLEQTLLSIKEYMENKNIRYSVVILLDHILQGGPIEKIERIMLENKIPFYNFAPLMPKINEYARDYTLGWDAHPNSAGTLLFAGLLKNILDYESIYQEQKSDFNEKYSVAQRLYDKEVIKTKQSQFKKFVESVYITGNTLDFKNAYIRERHIIYGNWDIFPLIDKKIDIRVDGIWTTKYLSLCYSSENSFKRARLYFTDFRFESDATKVFINGIEILYKIKQLNGKGYIEFYGDEVNQKKIQNLHFFELMFQFGDTFKDSKNRVFGPYITRFEIIE